MRGGGVGLLRSATSLSKTTKVFEYGVGGTACRLGMIDGNLVHRGLDSPEYMRR